MNESNLTFCIVFTGLDTFVQMNLGFYIKGVYYDDRVFIIKSYLKNILWKDLIIIIALIF